MSNVVSIHDSTLHQGHEAHESHHHETFLTKYIFIYKTKEYEF